MAWLLQYDWSESEIILGTSLKIAKRRETEYDNHKVSITLYLTNFSKLYDDVYSS